MNETLRVLILGGTSEASALATQLADRPEYSVLSSLAGRVIQPRLPAGNVRVGGFGGVDGLTDTLRDRRIGAVIDATHPFAERISSNAQEACSRANVPLLTLARAPWFRGPNDDWREVESLEEAAASAASIGRRIFLTTGRQNIAAFAQAPCWFLIRTIDPPKEQLPVRHELLMERGPFTLEHERRLLLSHHIDVLVSKNSGGDATYQKIFAARECGIPVVMLRRPPPPRVPSVDSVGAALAWMEGLH